MCGHARSMVDTSRGNDVAAGSCIPCTPGANTDRDEFLSAIAIPVAPSYQHMKQLLHN